MFKENFELQLQKKNVKAYEVSKATGISQGLLSEYKSGKKQPSIPNLQKLAEYFGCPVGDLLNGETSPAASDKAGSDAAYVRNGSAWNAEDTNDRFGYSDGFGGSSESSFENRNTINDKQGYAERILHREDAFARLFNRLSAEQQTEILKRMLEMQEGK